MSASTSSSSRSPWLVAADLLDPPEATDDIGRARQNPELFIDRFCWVIPASGGAPIPFRLWDFQRECLADFQTQRNVVVLKARQLGLSWLSLAYGLWMANCRPGHTVLILNRNLGAAVELLDRCRFMWKRLPPELQTRITQDTNDPKMPMLGFENGSRIISLPSTEDTGSGLTAQLIIADEVSKWPYAPQTFTAILAILAGGGTIIAISTAKGLGNYFADLWKRAQPGAENPNGYWPIFIPAEAHPERDEAWLAAMERTYPDRRRFLQEMPSTPLDAFQLADEAVFSEFDRAVHHRDFRRETQWPVVRGIDFGYHVAPCHWAEVQAERVVHVYSELYCREQTTVELAEAIVQRDLELGLDPALVAAGVDPAGKARTSQSGTESDHVTLRRAGIRDLRMVEPSVPSDRVDLIKRLLREERLVIDCKACPRLAEALEQAQWERRRGPDGQVIRGESYAKDGLHEHVLDSLGYMLINLFRPKGRPGGSQGAPPRPVRTSRYGSSEFA